MLWFKALHLIFMVTWFAGLFYLPRLFVYHTMSDDQASIERFKIMERKLYYGITTPGMVLTVIFGIGILMSGHYLDQLWIHIKLTLVGILIIYHIHCGKLVADFKHDRNRRSHVFYRWYNEFPVLLLIPIIFLAVFRPV
ncbi:MAG: protoporphyrinogen oxidase HemJ [Gammaproteobacteria bacterium]|nr:protoporphyrinogen oxidase HemJ [Gammaproteobacteria bacterium]